MIFAFTADMKIPRKIPEILVYFLILVQIFLKLTWGKRSIVESSKWKLKLIF